VHNLLKSGAGEASELTAMPFRALPSSDSAATEKPDVQPVLGPTFFSVRSRYWDGRLNAGV
jgi:hypothetical protein